MQVLSTLHGPFGYVSVLTPTWSIAASAARWITCCTGPIPTWKSRSWTTTASPTFATRALSRTALATATATFSHFAHLHLVGLFRLLLGSCFLSSRRKGVSLNLSAIPEGLGTLNSSSGHWGHRCLLRHTCLLELAPRLVQGRLYTGVRDK